MTKSSRFRSALLAAATLFAAGGARAQLVPTVLYDFSSGAIGTAPTGVTQVGSLLYGTLSGGGGQKGGVLYSFNPSTNVLAVIHSFPSGRLDGSNPNFPPIALNGMLYGTTASGGPAGGGIVYAIDPTTNIETIVHGFGSFDDGWLPQNLVALNGAIYGTTLYGGTGNINGGGTLFAINPATGVETILYNFQGQADGGWPGNLTVLNGILYGTTQLQGVLFQFNPATGIESSLSNLPLGDVMPRGPLILAGNMLYGVGLNFGSIGQGGIYSINTTTGYANTLYAFRGGVKDGETPGGNLLFSNGVLYGATIAGGSKGCSQKRGCGTLFGVTVTTGRETTLYKFAKGGPSAPSLYQGATTIYGTDTTSLFSWSP